MTLVDTVMTSPSGVTLTVDEWEHVWSYVRRPDRRFTVAIPELLEHLVELVDTAPRRTSDEFPFVLSAGERRSFTAKTIFRDPTWRRRDTEGALRISPADADRLCISPGDHVRITTQAGTAVAPVEITSLGMRDPFAGTP